MTVLPTARWPPMQSSRPWRSTAPASPLGPASKSSSRRGGGTSRSCKASVAVGETAILMTPPSFFVRCFNTDEKGVSVK